MPTVIETATALGVNASRVRQLILKGQLAAEKHGRDWWITEGEIARFKALARPPGWKKGKSRKQNGE